MKKVILIMVLLYSTLYGEVELEGVHPVVYGTSGIQVDGIKFTCITNVVYIAYASTLVKTYNWVTRQPYYCRKTSIRAVDVRWGREGSTFNQDAIEVSGSPRILTWIKEN